MLKDAERLPCLDGADRQARVGPSGDGYRRLSAANHVEGLTDCVRPRRARSCHGPGRPPQAEIDRHMAGSSIHHPARNRERVHLLGALAIELEIYRIHGALPAAAATDHGGRIERQLLRDLALRIAHSGARSE